jgi:hypothetical protein
MSSPSDDNTGSSGSSFNSSTYKSSQKSEEGLSLRNRVILFLLQTACDVFSNGVTSSSFDMANYSMANYLATYEQHEKRAVDLQVLGRQLMDGNIIDSSYQAYFGLGRAPDEDPVNRARQALSFFDAWIESLGAPYVLLVLSLVLVI